MKKLLLTLFTLLLVAPLASPQLLNGKGKASPKLGHSTLQLTPMQPGAMPQEILDMAKGHQPKGNLTMRRTSMQRVDENTTKVGYSTSYERKYYSQTYTYTWATTFTYNTADNTVVIEGLLDGMLDDVGNTITAPYVNGVITIPAAYPDSADASAYTVLGQYYGYDCYLFGGSLQEDGESVDMDDVVTLYVADDLSTVDNGGKVIGTYLIYFGSMNTVGYSTTGLVWNKIVDGPANSISTTELDFGTIMYPQSKSLTFDIKTMGSDTVAYKITSSDSHFTVDDSEGEIALLQTKTFTVTFDPNEIGEFNGNLTVVAGDSTYTVVCKGVATDIPRDFSDLVTKGDPSRFSWINDETYPWSITDGVATYGNNQVSESHSMLIGWLDCPKATRVTFDYQLKCQGQDTLIFSVDGHILKNLCSTGSLNAGTYSFVISSGNHGLAWDVYNGVYAGKGDYINISNIRLEDAEEFELVSPDGSVTDFAMYGAANYNGTVQDFNETTDVKTLTMNVNPTGAAAISFDVIAAEAYPVTITVDGTTDRTITANETYYYNFTEGGSHTVVATLGGYDAGVSEVYLTAGEYTKVSKTYLVNGQSYLNQDGALDLVNGVKLVYPVTVTTTSTGKVYFDNLVENDKVTKPRTIEGRLNNGVITIATPTKIVEGTLYGLDDNSEEYLDWYGYYNNRYWLESGTLESLESRDMKKGWVEEFTLTCNDDMSRLTANTGFGIWCTWSHGYNSGIVEFLKPGAMFYETVTGEVQAVAEMDTLDFGSCYANSSQITRTVMVLNLGDATDFEAYIEGTNKAMFTVTPTTGSMDAQGNQLFTVTYTPTRTGNHTAKLVVVTEGNEIEVVLVGQATEMPDYDSIVTEGLDYIRGWDTSSDYPWYVDNGIAYSGNKGVNNSTSLLSTDFTVPEGYYARVSADVKGFPEIYDAVYVDLDGETVESFNTLVKHGEFGKIVDEGEHTLKIWLEKGAEDRFLSDDQAQISNLRIRLYAKGSDVAMIQKPKWFFEELVAWDLGDSIWVALVNKGTNVLKVNSVTTDAPFRVGEIADVAAGETGYFRVYMNPCDPGNYTGTITLHTTAGDVPFEVEGTTDYVRYLGNYNAYAAGAPICAFYNAYQVYPSYVESVYEAEWLKGLKGAKFTDMTFFTQSLGRIDFQCKNVSWNVMEIDSPNEVPMEEQIIPEGLTNVYEGEQIDIEDYELTIPFAEPYVYQGSNFMYFQEQLAFEPFAYSFYFRSEGILKDDGTDDYDSKVTGIWIGGFEWQQNNYRPYLRIRYIPADDPSGVNELNVDEMQTVEGDGYTYDLMGRRVNPDNLAPGIYIRNGQKFMVK